MNEELLEKLVILTEERAAYLKIVARGLVIAQVNPLALVGVDVAMQGYRQLGEYERALLSGDEAQKEAVVQDMAQVLAEAGERFRAALAELRVG